MPVMLERWNDDRMDALDTKVDALDTKVAALDMKVVALDAKVDGLSGQMREQRQETLELRQEMKAGFERMHRLMIQFGGMIIVALIGLSRL